jgi:hypothetical protein
MRRNDEIAAQAARRFETLRQMHPQPGYAAAFPWDSQARLIVVPLNPMTPGEINADNFSVICEFNGQQISLPAFRNLRFDVNGRATVELATAQLSTNKPVPEDRALFIADNQIALLFPFVTPPATPTDYLAEINDLLRRRTQFSRRALIDKLDEIAERAAKEGITIDVDAILFSTPTK